jgi:hypothetical protein
VGKGPLSVTDKLVHRDSVCGGRVRGENTNQEDIFINFSDYALRFTKQSCILLYVRK